MIQRNIILFFITIFISINIYSQEIDTNKYLFLKIPSGVIIKKFNILDTLSSQEVNDWFGINTNEKGVHYNLECELKGLVFYVDWYEVDSVRMVKEKSLYLIKLIEKNIFDCTKKIDFNLLSKNLEFKEFGIKKINFKNIQEGIYKDKWFNCKAMEFILRYDLIDISLKYPNDFESLGYIDYRKISTDFSVNLKLVLKFESLVSNLVSSPSMRRIIYIDINSLNILSCQILSPLQFIHYDVW